jgi:hypothetical protein
MKKQKMLKLTAFPSNPVIENAFSAPVTHSGEVSVVFKGKNVSIHGWDGSSWSTIYTWNSLDPQYQFNNTYQSYYLKSLTGSEETINVSFFSAESYQGSTPLLVGIDRGTKLYDIDEVPIYTADDHNKMLTVMSNGSLAWLLANESFIVPEEGGEEGGGGNVIAGTFLEDISTVVARQPSKISSGIYTDNSHGGSIGMSVLLKDDGILAYDPNTNETVNDEFTISWWMNLDASQAASNLGLAGINVGQVNGVVRRFAFDLGNGSSLVNPHFISYTRNPKTTNNLRTGVSMAGVWTHVAIVIKNDGSNTVGSIYLNGSKLNNGFSYPLGTKVFPPSTHQEFMFGAGFQSNSVKGQFDSMQIADGTALTDSQVAAIAGQADRQMSIETAAQG